MNPNLRAAVTEFVGTFALVLLTSGAVIADGVPALSGQSGFGKLGIALAAGLAYAAALAFTVRASGGFLNPAVTVTLWVFQRLENPKAVYLLGAQLAGAIVAGLALRGLFLVNASALIETRMGVPHLNLTAFDVSQVDRSSVFLGIGLETLLTFLLVFAIFALFFDSRFRRTAGETVHRLNYLWLGLFVVAITLAAGGWTGASMNPARWFGTVVWEMTMPGLEERRPWADHGPYWIGPILGSLLAGVLYTYVVLPPDDRQGAPKAGMP
jgi:glycerol uptake facilitator-like aquaporin